MWTFCVCLGFYLFIQINVAEHGGLWASCLTILSYTSSSVFGEEEADDASEFRDSGDSDTYCESDPTLEQGGLTKLAKLVSHVHKSTTATDLLEGEKKL